MATRSLLSGPVTLFDAEGRDRNILHALQYRKQEKAFCERIEGFRPLLTDVVAHHLSIKAAEVNISPQEHWLHGSFNLCVPVLVEADETRSTTVPKFVIIRFPLPYRVGEATNSGNSDEKINTEAKTYHGSSGIALKSLFHKSMALVYLSIEGGRISNTFPAGLAGCAGSTLLATRSGLFRSPQTMCIAAPVTSPSLTLFIYS
ncbi:hypothetical protein IF1G_06879 [Cordyceps javanica]|uniref:Uncharacterized protein n=1 Tax=Cordyceps javanica TaxID=43265 RepID=A0A545UZI7_9HYPO|nr:hypothetical protein IF1G_06879 [Cordyceps javanica]